MLIALGQQGFGQTAKKHQMRTPWSKTAGKGLPLNEYPRPQMVRDNWVNLNGPWQYSIEPRDAGAPSAWQGTILVPFPIEAPLSGVERTVAPDSALWYHRTFVLKGKPLHKKMVLHVGAADYEATVYVNGQPVTTHKGGYTSFSADITPFLKGGNEELMIRVWDPTDKGEQARGKQTDHPGGIYYTSVTGIWQTVWYEVVPES